MTPEVFQAATLFLRDEARALHAVQVGEHMMTRHELADLLQALAGGQRAKFVPVPRPPLMRRIWEALHP